MTAEERTMLNRIYDYANEVLGEIDPQKTPVSFQLQQLRPIMQQIAMEQGKPVEEVFIKYMDLASEAAVQREMDFQADINGGMPPSFSSMANKLK